MPVADHDVERLRRAIALAAKGRFAVEPNPIVGCVIERDGRIVGEGWHQAYGGPHAEARALALAGEGARGATAYVSLEPCTGTGKKTPPCAEALVAAGIRRLVYAATDPNPAMTGLGVAKLRAAGIEVEGPVLRNELVSCLAPVERPWTIAKWAMSWDGRIAPAAGVGGRLSGPAALAFAHELRGRVEAVAVGIGTVLTDDPRLTCRLDGGPPDGRSQPLRVVFDTGLRTPPASRMLRDGAAPVVVVAGRSGRVPGAEVWGMPGGPDGRVDLVGTLARLRRERGVHRLLVEGGSRVHGALFRAGLVDQATVIVTPRVLGAAGAPAAVEGTGFVDLEAAPRLRDVAWRPLGEDFLLQGYVSSAEVSGRSAARS